MHQRAPARPVLAMLNSGRAVAEGRRFWGVWQFAKHATLKLVPASPRTSTALDERYTLWCFGPRPPPGQVEAFPSREALLEALRAGAHATGIPIATPCTTCTGWGVWPYVLTLWGVDCAAAAGRAGGLLLACALRQRHTAATTRRRPPMEPPTAAPITAAPSSEVLSPPPPPALGATRSG